MKAVTKIMWRALCILMPKIAVKIQYKHIMKMPIDLRNPKDLNEKINYLKFNADTEEWTRLSDKYEVRKYVEERGLADILVPLYGKYDVPKELIQDWENLPESFVIKANHGCGTVKIVRNKQTVDKIQLEKEMSSWLKERYGLETNERHYLKIKPCLIVEALLEDLSVKEFSRSPLDYKIWCFDGKPYCIFVCADRCLEMKEKGHRVQFDTYDVNWERIDNALDESRPLPQYFIDCPKNLEYMLECASLLSMNHKQVRVDLYNVNGKIYFGEMTFTSQGGYMNYFSKEFLSEMGKQFEVR